MFPEIHFKIHNSKKKRKQFKHFGGYVFHDSFFGKWYYKKNVVKR